MTKRWDEMWDIFHEAVELAEEERAAFLDKKCADDAELRAEVESLIASHGESDRLPDAVPIICSPGDVAITNRQTVHGSFANTSDRWRITINFGFLPRALTYHAVLSVAAAAVWLLVTKHCWPENLAVTSDSQSKDGRR